MNEAQQLMFIASRCAENSLLWHHCNDSKRCTGSAGMPDVIIVGVRGMLFRELKTGIGRRSAKQTEWYWNLKAVGADVGTWREDDFNNGTVEREIAALARA